MAKRKIVWSPDAEIDLLKILEYFFIRNGSKTYSVHLNSKIHKTVKLLSNHLFLGLQSDI
jgi:plasmid stabilization system protein ParE